MKIKPLLLSFLCLSSTVGSYSYAQEQMVIHQTYGGAEQNTALANVPEFSGVQHAFSDAPSAEVFTAPSQNIGNEQVALANDPNFAANQNILPQMPAPNSLPLTEPAQGISALSSECPDFTSVDAGVDYLPLGQIVPAQIRYSQDNVNEKIKDALKKKNALEVGKVCHNGGTSIFPASEAVPVIKAPDNLLRGRQGPLYVLIDGHHSVKASFQLGATMIPIKIKEDWSNENPNTFWAKAESKGYAHLYNLEGQKLTPPTSFDQLINDPIRGLMAKVAIKCTFGKPLPKFDPKRVLWVKVTKQGEKDIPFIEFKAADSLRMGGFAYQDGQKVTDVMMYQARAILTNPATQVPGLRVISSNNQGTLMVNGQESLESVCGVPAEMMPSPIN